MCGNTTAIVIRYSIGQACKRLTTKVKLSPFLSFSRLAPTKGKCNLSAEYVLPIQRLISPIKYM